MKVGVLTGGGDCPGLNAVIRAIVRTIHNGGGETDWPSGRLARSIEGNSCSWPPKRPTALSTGEERYSARRHQSLQEAGGRDRLVATFKRLELDALIAIGGDDTLGVATSSSPDRGMTDRRRPEDHRQRSHSTDFTFGFDTCINIVMEAIDRLKTTAESHRRIMVIETMGRHAGWIACYSGVASAADFILVPEAVVDIERMCELLKKRRAGANRTASSSSAKEPSFPTRPSS